MAYTDKGAAEVWRLLAEYYLLRQDPTRALDCCKQADALDPPSPDFPDGTVAWVKVDAFGAMTPFLMRRHEGSWQSGQPVEGSIHSTYPDDEVEVVEVIPTVPEGHVTLPGDLEYEPAMLREFADEIGKAWPTCEAILRAYAGAIEDAKEQS